MKEQEKKYCSLDIETSGFDPLANEILEVGFAFFTFGENGIEITEEWTQVFKPSKAVSPQILGLTGISQKELDAAPTFSEYHEFLQAKLGTAEIVGHNISFDTKFLESFGIKFSGRLIDTLDLVQWILPTHHSYNLENLMHTFGISHKEAHRALADSKATLKLLEKLLQLYSGFPQALKLQLKKQVAGYNFSWEDFLKFEFKPLSLEQVFTKQTREKVAKPVKQGLVLEAGAFYNFPPEAGYLDNLSALKPEHKLLLAVPKLQDAMDLYKRGLVNGVAFLPEQRFNEKKFLALQKKKNLSVEEIKFLLKLLVWKNTNWQTETLLDLNLSFFGGQFKSLVSGGSTIENKTAKVLVCDHAAFLNFSDNGYYKNRHLVICGLNELESCITSSIGTKASWGYINYLLKSFYNPELGAGQEKFKQAVEKGLLASDLFFGLVNALLKTDEATFVYYKISEQVQYDENFQKIRGAALSFVEKISETAEILGSKEIKVFAANLQSFFEKEENRVKWIEIADKRCVFFSMPLNITSLVKNILQPFAFVSFADSLGTKSLAEFFLKRLGLGNVKILPSEALAVSSATKQGDLFSGIKKVFSKNRAINYHCLEHTASPQDILGILDAAKALPAAVLFANPAGARDFYDENYLKLKEKGSLLLQSASGGSNKIFRNFSIHNNGLLLATDKLVLKHLSSQAPLESVGRLEVKTLIVCRLPFEQFTHPYQEAISQSLPNAFEDYALPRALFNFHSLVKFFYTPALTDVYVIDAKLSKPYAKVFKEYYKAIPKARLIP
jgi:DNA polymerase III epsilon subunit-like protein